MAEVVYSLGALGEQLREVSMVSELDMLFSIVNGRAPCAPLHPQHPPKHAPGDALRRSHSAMEVRPVPCAARASIHDNAIVPPLDGRVTGAGIRAVSQVHASGSAACKVLITSILIACCVAQ